LFHYIANRIGVVSTPSIPLLLPVAVVAGIVAVANLAAAWPARSARASSRRWCCAAPDWPCPSR
jgi:hypothetical protein